MSGNSLLALLAGVVIVAAFVLVLPKAFVADTRGARLQISLLFILVVSLALYFSFEALWWALAGAIISGSIKVFLNYRQTRNIDYVAEEPLLSESVSPELAVQLENLGSDFRNQPQKRPEAEGKEENPPSLY